MLTLIESIRSENKYVAGLLGVCFVECASDHFKRALNGIISAQTKAISLIRIVMKKMNYPLRCDAL